MGILDRATEAAKSAVSTAGQAVSNAAQQVGESIQSAGQSLGQRFSDDTDAETEPEVDQEEQDQEQQDVEVESNGIDPDETPDNVRNPDTGELYQISAKREFSFIISPSLDPNEYLEQQRTEALAEWVQSSILTDEFQAVNVDFDELQLAVRYEIIQDGEIFDTSRRRSKQIAIDVPDSAAQDLRNKIRGLADIQEDSYDAILILSEHILIFQRS